jgi:hypothetical protein
MANRFFAAALALSMVAVPVLSQPSAPDAPVGKAAATARMISASAANNAVYGPGQGAPIHDGVG